jgi:hypothetical protein
MALALVTISGLTPLAFAVQRNNIASSNQAGDNTKRVSKRR